MTTPPLADLRLDIRDLPGVTFVATTGDERDLRVQVTVDDPAVAEAVRAGVAELARRHLGTAVDVEVEVAGLRRSPLAIVVELGTVPGVRSVEVVRGTRGEVLRLTVTTGSPLAARHVAEFVTRRLGSRFHRERTDVVEVADSRA